MIKASQVSFDARGNPQPYGFIQLSLDSFHETFVLSMNGSSARTAIYDGFRRYSRALFSAIRADWFQWVDGSYTTKKPEPFDLDAVSVIRIDVVDANIASVRPLFMGSGDPLTTYKVHAFLVTECDPTDHRYAYCESRKAYWTNWFGRDRNKNPKGIVVLHETGDA